MGCSCMKSDVVVKNPKSANNSEVAHNNNRREIERSNNYNVAVNNSNNRRSSNIEVNNNNNRSSNVHNPSRNSNAGGINQNVLNYGNNVRVVAVNNVNTGMPFLPSQSDPNYHFREISDVMVGSGLKKMKAYISPINREELEKKRSEFWGTRVEGNKETWEFLRMICSSNEIEEAYIKEFLNAAGVTPVGNSIGLTFDSRGYYYELPNYCINEPYKFEIATDNIVKSRPIKKNIEIIIRKLVNDRCLAISNLAKVGELKSMIVSFFSKEYQEEYLIERIRLFFGGKELNNDNELWNYNIVEGSIIQMMYKTLDT